ncbi:MAG: NUDIX hydrolase [Granulosicoccaceae bacterium]
MNARNPPPSSDTPDALPKRRAAVLAPLQRIEDEWHLLLIKRATREGDRHSGQVAFPGGRVEPEDPSLTAAALREAEEEIGLSPSHVEVLGPLPDYTTITNYLVTPVAAIVHTPFQPVLQAAEVSKLFSVPLYWLADPNNHQRRTWHPSRPKVIYFQDWQGETLWGATAAMTLHLLDAIEQGRLSLPS